MDEEKIIENKDIILDENVGDTSENDVTFEATDEEGVLESKDAKIKKLRLEIEKLRKERDEYLTGWQRTKADYVNRERASTEEKGELIRVAARRTLQAILPSLDTYDMAKVNVSVWNAVDANWRAGIEYIFQQLVSSLENEGLVKFGLVGDVFDPNLHESVEAIPVSDRMKDNTVMTVLQSGYKLHEKVLRPARVNVGIYQEIE